MPRSKLIHDLINFDSYILYLCIVNELEDQIHILRHPTQYDNGSGLIRPAPVQLTPAGTVTFVLQFLKSAVCLGRFLFGHYNEA